MAYQPVSLVADPESPGTIFNPPHADLVDLAESILGNGPSNCIPVLFDGQRNVKVLSSLGMFCPLSGVYVGDKLDVALGVDAEWSHGILRRDSDGSILSVDEHYAGIKKIAKSYDRRSVVHRSDWRYRPGWKVYLNFSSLGVVDWEAYHIGESWPVHKLSGLAVLRTYTQKEFVMISHAILQQLLGDCGADSDVWCADFSSAHYVTWHFYATDRWIDKIYRSDGVVETAEPIAVDQLSGKVSSHIPWELEARPTVSAQLVELHGQESGMVSRKDEHAPTTMSGLQLKVKKGREYWCVCAYTLPFVCNLCGGRK